MTLMNGARPQQPGSSRPTRLGATDDAVRRALGLLKSSGPDPTRILVVDSRDVGPRVPGQPVAWTLNGTVYVSDKTRAYKTAMKGQAIELAAALIHEQAHLDGEDELAAYTAQLAILHQLHAPADVIRDVERSKAVVVQKHADLAAAADKVAMAEQRRVFIEAYRAIREANEKRRRPGREDALVKLAIAMLDHPPDLSIVRVTPLLDAAAVCRLTEGTIFISPHSQAYQCAEAGDVVPLAALIAHEAHHLRHGKEEAAAYDAQIRTLRELGASPEQIRAVERAKKEYA